MSSTPPTFDPLGSVISPRVERLGALPADATQLDRRLDALLDEDTTTHRPTAARRWMPWSALLAALICIAFAVTLRDAETVVASPSQLVQLHRQVTGGHLNVSATRNLDPLGEMIRGGPLPATEADFPAPLVHASCLRTVNGTRAAGVFIEYSPHSVTVVIVEDAESRLALPPGATLEQGGRPFVVVTSQRPAIVAARIGGKIICAVGDTEPENLVTLLATLAK